MASIDLRGIGTKWQQRWAESAIFKVSEDADKKKFYCLEMYPYPSGNLHIGHLRNYSIGDALARYKRMQGFNVLYPMGYDAFGLPAENAAIKNKVDPEKWTLQNIAAIRAQQKSLGLSYDWEREIASLHPDYYKWNQWIFLKLYEKGLAYKKAAMVNWCPSCTTVLANEQVEGGKCWRCRSVVEQKQLEQWFFKITEYADQLLDDIKKLEGWPERVRVMQENWIGRSEGVEIHFKVKDSDLVLPAYTTRADTIFSVTFVVIAPEHPLVEQLIAGTEHEDNVRDTIATIRTQSIIERTSPAGKDKIGAFTGKYAINPANGEHIPVYIANFALMDYGTGIVMADAHDARDFEFAQKYKIPLKFVISPDGSEVAAQRADNAYTDDGILFNSGQFSGMANRDALPKMKDWLVESNAATKTVHYKLRDWLISRQRYWGTPIPIIYCEKCGTVPAQLPVLLPKDVAFTGESNPLETSESFVNTTCPKCSGNARRETDTMDTFVDSSWYFLRYCSPQEDKLPFSKDAAQYWMSVDQYIGGIEHAVLHLLYARFFTKALRDLSLVNVDEPFARLLCQGMVNKTVPYCENEKRELHVENFGKKTCPSCGSPLTERSAKMSKSLGNTVVPSDIIDKYGPDTARLFILFAALPEKELEWSDAGVEGSFRFLRRVAALADQPIFTGSVDAATLSVKDRHIRSKTHLTIKKVSQALDEFRYNAAIGFIMELVSALTRYEKKDSPVFGEAMKILSQLLCPFTPHLAEELWQQCGQDSFVSTSSWPAADENLIDLEAEAVEGIVEQLRSDLAHVLELTGITPKKITLFTSQSWKYPLYAKLSKLLDTTRNIGELMNALADKEHGKDIAHIVQRAVKDPTSVPTTVLSAESETSGIAENIDTLKSFCPAIQVVAGDEAQHPKAKQAAPGKPAILVE